MTRDQIAAQILCSLLPNYIADRNDGQVDTDSLVGVSVALADKLIAATAPVVETAPQIALTDRDVAIWRALATHIRSWPNGALSSYWKSAALQYGYGSRRAWETSSARLRAAGKVRKEGARWFLVEHPPARETTGSE